MIGRPPLWWAVSYENIMERAEKEKGATKDAENSSREEKEKDKHI